MTTPRCESRGLLYDTDNGPRISIGLLFAKLTFAERIAWDRYSGRCEQDEAGIFPEGIKKFLESIDG